MLNSLRIRNFKGWSDTGLIEFAPITAFFGANSSGKSSILQFLLLLKQTAEQKNSKVLNLGGHTSNYVDFGNIEEILYKHDRSNNIQFEVSFGTPPTKLGSEISTANTGFVIESLNLDGNKKSFSYRQGRPTEIRYGKGKGKALKEHPFAPPSNIFDFNPMEYNIIDRELFEFMLETDWNTRRSLDRMRYVGPVRHRPQRYYLTTGQEVSSVGVFGEATVDVLTTFPNERDVRFEIQSLQQRVAYWMKELELTDGFTLKPLDTFGRLLELRVKTSRASTDVSISDAGFGISQILPILVEAFVAKPESTLLLEQPELHLHPAVQAKLADLFIELANNYRIQIIVESHSEHFLRRLQQRIAEEKFDSNSTKIYFCQQGKNGCNIEQLLIDQYGDIANWPKDFFGDVVADVNARAQAKIKRKAELKKRR